MSKLERFNIGQIPREHIKNAPYNPRVISAKARARLKRGLEEEGLVAPLIWNKRTGNLVGGHQRLSIIDEVEGTKDYSLTVSVIDVTEASERRLNVLLNNESAMGQWDERKLLDLIAAEPQVDFEALGFSDNERAYYSELLQANEQENAAVVAAMTDAVEFQETVAMHDEESDHAARHEDKLTRKQQYEAQVHALLRPQDDAAWKVKTDEEKQAYDRARTGYKEETTDFASVRIMFDTPEDLKRWLARFGLTPKAVIHISELVEQNGE